MEVGAVILVVPQFADACSPFSLKIDGGRVKENTIQTAEKITLRQEKILFYYVLCATRSEGSAILLIFELLSQKGHRPVEMMQGQGVDAINHVIPVPPVTGPVRSGDEEPMQNRKENRSLHIETKLSLCQKAANDLADLKFFPKSLADQHGTDLLGFRPDVALSGQDQKNLFGKPGKGAHQALNLPLLLDLIHPADGGDDTLDGLGAFPTVLDDLKVLIMTGFFHSRKHGASP
jgi:hypothetical protein